MSPIKFTEAELMALFGLPHLSIVLYMLGIRPRMDFVKGTVGEKPLISWQALREAVYVEPHPGIKHEYASLEAVRRAAVWLEKAGLIQMRSRERQLIFFLPLAHADYSARNKADSSPTGQADRAPTGRKPYAATDSDRFLEESRRKEFEKADEHPESGNSLTTTSQALSSSRQNEEGLVGGGVEWIYPKSLTTQQTASIGKKIEGLGQDIGQAVLDELEGCIQAGTVKNLPALLRFFVEQGKTGEFIPDKGVAVRKAREARAQEEVRRIEYEKQASQEAQQSTRGAGKPGNLRDLVKRRVA